MKILKQHGRRTFSFMLVFLISAVLFLWSWNSTMPDLLGLLPIQFKQALGLIMLVGILSFPFHLGRWQGRRENASPYHNDSVGEK
jgi:asparagine N-glycosylation enzyme membrane subunit Stt3